MSNRKHLLKHQKPFVCDYSNCKRAGQGFTTVNDLDRHKKSVHRIGLPSKSYQCASKTCRNKEKIWPRLDNFKQHVERMHPEEDEIDLIKRYKLVYIQKGYTNHDRSLFRPNEQGSALADLTVAPLDTTHVVSGMEKSLSNNPLLDPVPIMDGPLEPDTERWPSYKDIAKDFAKDVHTMATPVAKGARGSSASRNRGGAPSNNHQNVPGAIGRRKLSAAIPSETVQTGSKVAPTMSRSSSRAQLTNAPQTKAEQQRSALQKFSQVVTNEIKSSTKPVDLEELVLRILHRSTDSVKWDDQSSRDNENPEQPRERTAATLTRSEALQASQAISNLIKQSPGSAHTEQRRSNLGFLPQNVKLCEKCNYAVARDCDMRKHMKRHDKPYGCTYAKCHKRFGAKSDWKRHEQSQHFQLEAFRCEQRSTTAPDTICSQHFFRLKHIEDHLVTQHKMTDSTKVKKEVGLCKIGKNCQGSFWCGFCKKVVALKERRNAAWDERFDHIAHHFEKEKKSIDEWVCVEENQTKRELMKERDRYVFPDEQERDHDAPGEAEHESARPPVIVPGELPVPTTSELPPPPPQVAPTSNSLKRRSNADGSSERFAKHRKTTVITRHCVSAPRPMQ